MTPQQCKGARFLLGISIAELADASGVSHATIRAFEGGAVNTHAVKQEKIKVALEGRGVVFRVAPDPGRHPSPSLLRFDDGSSVELGQA